MVSTWIFLILLKYQTELVLSIRVPSDVVICLVIVASLLQDFVRSLVVEIYGGCVLLVDNENF